MSKNVRVLAEAQIINTSKLNSLISGLSILSQNKSYRGVMPDSLSISFKELQNELQTLLSKKKSIEEANGPERSTYKYSLESIEKVKEDMKNIEKDLADIREIFYSILQDKFKNIDIISLLTSIVFDKIGYFPKTKKIERFEDLPKIGDEKVLYIDINQGNHYYWANDNYQTVISLWNDELIGASYKFYNRFLSVALDYDGHTVIFNFTYAK